MPHSRTKHHNPRWHLVNLIPIWTSQALTSVLIACVPFFCFFSCRGGPNTPLQNAAIAIWAISFAAIAIEVLLFARAYLTLLASLVMQIVKVLIVWAQWAIAVRNDNPGPSENSERWKMVRLSVLFTALSLPFFIHFLYALAAFFHSKLFNRDEGSRVEKDILILGQGDDQRSESIENDFRWPMKGGLWPNWILQLAFIPIISLARLMGVSATYHSLGSLYQISTYIIPIFLASPVLCGICYSFRKDGKRLSLRTYLQVQLFKIVALYFMLDLIVATFGGWKLQADRWVQSLFWVFILSIMLGSSYIAEFVFAIAVYMRYQQKSAEGLEEIPLNRTISRLGQRKNPGVTTCILTGDF